MSMRFNQWASNWIEENILPGANTDIETYEDRAKRLIGEMFAEAAEAKFKKHEMKVSDNRDFDYDVYKLKFLLAEELEDGD